MPEMDDVLDDVRREVKRYGDAVKRLTESMQPDLKSVRELAEDAGKKPADGIQLKKDLEALSAGVAEKHAAIETLATGMVAADKRDDGAPVAEGGKQHTHKQPTTPHTRP